MARAQAPVSRNERPSRRQAKARANLAPVSNASQALLSEIERDLENACKGFSDMENKIRRFASSQLSSEKMTVLGVLSAHPGEGRTTVALNLAAALAEVHGKVLLVETEEDQSGTLAADLDDEITPGLNGYLSEQASLDEVVRPTKHKGLWLIPSGGPDHPISALSSVSNMRMLFSLLRPRYDVTVVDLPPLLSSEDVPALLSYLDGIVLVVAAGKTSSEDVANALAHCGTVPIKGVVLNKASSSIPRWLKTLIRV